MFWDGVRSRTENREPKKDQKTVERCSDPKKKSKLGFAKKKISSLGPLWKNLLRLLDEKRKKRKSKKKSKIQRKTHSQNTKSFLSLVLHRHATITTST